MRSVTSESAEQQITIQLPSARQDSHERTFEADPTAQSNESPIFAAIKDLSFSEQKSFIEAIARDVARARTLVIESRLEATMAETKPSPAFAAGKAGAQESTDRLNQNLQTRLLTAAEMAEYAGRSRSWPAESAHKHRLIAVTHAGRTFYPAFQIDPHQRELRDWVPTMVGLMRDMGMSGRSFVLWAATPSPRFNGAMPAGRVDDPDFLVKAAGDLADL